MIMARKNWTYDWLGGKLGMHPDSVRRLIYGRRCARPEVRERFLTVFRGKRWDDLFKIQDGTTTAVGDR